jgi:hypothetical protein
VGRRAIHAIESMCGKGHYHVFTVAPKGAEGTLPALTKSPHYLTNQRIKSLIYQVARPKGFEPLTSAFGGHRLMFDKVC